MRYPERMVDNAKRFMGEKDHVWEIDGVFYTPVDISAFVLRKLKEDTERHLNGPIDQAILTVPAHFTAHQRQQTMEAGRQAGLHVRDIVNEPVAASLAYILGKEGLAYAGLADDRTVLVYDLGGGTFDLSLVRYNQDQVRVLAAGGDMRLGGIDWNRRIVDHLAEQFRRVHPVDLRNDRRGMRQLLTLAEEFKRSLTNSRKAEGLVHWKGQELEVRVSRDEFERWTRDLTERTRMLTEQLLKRAGLHWLRIDLVLPVGGATRMPMIRDIIKAMTQDVVAVHELPPDLAIAQGAALYGGVVNHQLLEETAVSERAVKGPLPSKVTNISSHSLGLIVLTDRGQRINHVLIPRHSPLPFSASVAVGTVVHNQSRIKLRIVEGDQQVYQPGSEICQCVIDNLPPGLPESSLFDVDLLFDTNGLLHVNAKHRDSGLLSTVIVQRATI
jgi:molecular chaperone DnaK